MAQQLTDCQEMLKLYADVRKRFFDAYLRNVSQCNIRKKFRVGDRVWKWNLNENVLGNWPVKDFKSTYSNLDSENAEELGHASLHK